MNLQCEIQRKIIFYKNVNYKVSSRYFGFSDPATSWQNVHVLIFLFSTPGGEPLAKCPFVDFPILNSRWRTACKMSMC
jgi:hypothetical protein